MLEGLYAAASGMEAQQQQLDSIGNDLANVSTTGYKAERVGFRDLLYNQVNIAGTTATRGAGAGRPDDRPRPVPGGDPEYRQPPRPRDRGPRVLHRQARRRHRRADARRRLRGRLARPAHHRRRRPARSADHAAQGDIPERCCDRPRRHRACRRQDRRQDRARHRRLARSPARRRRQPLLPTACQRRYPAQRRVPRSSRERWRAPTWTSAPTWCR